MRDNRRERCGEDKPHENSHCWTARGIASAVGRTPPIRRQCGAGNGFLRNSSAATELYLLAAPGEEPGDLSDVAPVKAIVPRAVSRRAGRHSTRESIE